MCWATQSSGIALSCYGGRSSNGLSILNIWAKEERRRNVWRQPKIAWHRQKEYRTRVTRRVRSAPVRRPQTISSKKQKVWPVYSPDTGRRIKGLYTDGTNTFKKTPRLKISALATPRTEPRRVSVSSHLDGSITPLVAFNVSIF